uniref:Uncharacterized protein n=1 Tax=Acrobeloides nanus TaxID=290746 RepID=A0A914CVL1_9BILA
MSSSIKNIDLKYSYDKYGNLAEMIIFSITRLLYNVFFIFATLFTKALTEKANLKQLIESPHPHECSPKETYSFSKEILFTKNSLPHLYDKSTSVQKFNNYLENFFASNNSVTRKEWDLALPTSDERQEMKQLINYLYGLYTFNEIQSNAILNSFPKLQKWVNLTFIEGKYCIIHEIIPSGCRFPRFWGYTALCARKYALKPNLHHSASHFESDGDVCNEAATIFESTGSRSLVVAGANRYAVRGDNPSSCQPSYQIADASHNNDPMFFTMNVAVHDAAKQHASKNSLPFNDTFIEWHGMAETSCLSAPIFISAGVHGNHFIYGDKNSTVNRIRDSVNKNFGSTSSAQTPHTDESCKLIASSNVFGRYVNSVPESDVCTIEAKIRDIHSQFVHIEQKHNARCSWDLWVKSINDAFPI